MTVASARFLTAAKVCGLVGSSIGIAYVLTRKLINTEGEMPGTRPSNFSWVVDDVLAGSSYPNHKRHFQYYMDNGIRHVITLTEFKAPMHLAPPGLSNTFMPVVEFEPPSLQQIIQFVDIVENARDKKEGVVVHCHWGRGRTGTMLAAYLVKDRHMDPRDAIEEIRSRRPYSVETYEQEDSVIAFADFLKDTANPDQMLHLGGVQHH